MSNNAYYPLSNAIASDEMRSDFLALLGNILDNIAYVDTYVLGDNIYGSHVAVYRVMVETACSPPLLGGMEFIVGGGDIILEIYYTDNKFNALFESSQLKLRFPRKWLQPVITDANGNYIADPNESNFVELEFPVGVLFDQDLDFDVFYPTSNFSGLNFPLAMIGNTGFIFSLTDLKVDFSRKKNIQPAIDDGRADGFIGMYVADTTLILPQFWKKDTSQNSSAVIKATNFLVGTGGISGTLSLFATNAGDLLHIKLGDNGFKIAFDAFDLTLKQNSVVNSNIRGSLTVPGFKDDNGNPAKIDITVGMVNGGFDITAFSDNIPSIGIANVFSFKPDSLSIGKEEGRGYLDLSGQLDITADFGVDTNLPKGLEIPKLRIWEDGTFEMPLDKPPFPSEVRLVFKPVELYVSNMHIGSYEKNGRPYKYFGFDGGIDTNPTSVDAKGTGIKLYFSVDGGPLDIFVRIQRIDIDLIIPASGGAENAALVLKGFLAVRDGGNGTTEYAGGVDITLPRLNFRGSAAMRRNPQKPNFIVDAQIEMNKGIPLGSTGLSIYGFRGLVGKNYVATKQAA